MRKNFKNPQINPEFESILNNEFEQEWSNYITAAKNYASPLYNWLTGSSPASHPPAAKVPGYVNPIGSYVPSPPTMPLPSGTGKVSLQNILNAMARKKYIIYQEPNKLNIVGVRANTAEPNSFDDTINVFYKNSGGSWQFKSYRSTTDPGTFYLNAPMNVNGTAIVIPGQYINSHQIGLHKGEYTALVQRGPIKVTRDFNKDSKLDFKSGREETGYFGINIHRATSSGTSTTVNKWSAGCQVFASSSEFAEFISLCQQHSSQHGNNFTYTLLEEADL
jgi:hypothetical protein